MQLGIFAKTFAGTDPDLVLRQVRQAGYHSAHYNMSCSGLDSMPLEIADDVVEAVIGASQKADVSLCGLSATYNMIHPDPAVRADGLQRLACLIRAAARIGIDVVTLCTGTRDPDDQWRSHPENQTPEAWADLLTEMEKAVTLAEAHGVRLGIEPELANVVDSSAKAAHLLTEIRSDCLKIVLDPANLFERATLDAQRKLISDAVETLGENIVMAHAKDRATDGSFTVPGRGVIDFSHFLHCLGDAGFQGPLVTHGLAASDAKPVADYLGGLLHGGKE